MSVSVQRLLWGIVVCASAVFLLIRIWALNPLYVDAALRGSLQTALEQISDERGWLLSDIQIDDVTADRIHLTYRPHLRGPDPHSCFVLELATSSLAPCPDE